MFCESLRNGTLFIEKFEFLWFTNKLPNFFLARGEPALLGWLMHLSMMTSSNGNIFRVTGPLWGESTGHRWIPPQSPVAHTFDPFFDVRLNKRLSKHSRRQRFETAWRSLWRHSNDLLRPCQAMTCDRGICGRGLSINNRWNYCVLVTNRSMLRSSNLYYSKCMYPSYIQLNTDTLYCVQTQLQISALCCLVLKVWYVYF